MMISFSMIILGSHLITAVADNVPIFDIERGCRLDSAATQGVDLAQPIKKCVSDGQQARQQLEEQWSQFLAPTGQAAPQTPRVVVRRVMSSC